MIVGIDEVGRGCIAGDLLVCAYAVRPGLDAEARARLEQVAMDSKAFSSRSRREGAEAVVRECGVFEIARANPQLIDEMNIRGATLWAMSQAASKLQIRYAQACQFLFDGKDCPPEFLGRGEAIVKGDGKILEISAASVIAKTMRDREMEDEAIRFPGYGFEKHAGYGTVQHRTAIAELGLTSIHRSWARKFLPSNQ